ncbi:hypothetical protein KKB44_00505 [Candidatus Micrarchaeota archaeon]|nr:hypothetical protein [Candidatus Micrarchaeota archaeon]
MTFNHLARGLPIDKTDRSQPISKILDAAKKRVGEVEARIQRTRTLEAVVRGPSGLANQNSSVEILGIVVRELDGEEPRNGKSIVETSSGRFVVRTATMDEIEAIACAMLV